MEHTGSFYVDFSELSEFREALHLGPRIFREEVQAGFDEAVGLLLEELSEYPEYEHRQHGGPYAGFYSERQRKAVILSILEGILQVPYRRTYDLARGWQATDVQADDQNIRATIENKATNERGQGYAAAVMGMPQEALFYGYWPMIREIDERVEPAMREIIFEAVERAIRRTIRRYGSTRVTSQLDNLQNISF
ncbi:MAG TPA: hypothetical protein VGA61_04425 [Anaerolineae bacterium]